METSGTTNTAATPPRSRRARWAVALSLMVAGLGGLVVWALGTPDAVAYYKTPSELSAGDGSERLRVGGRLVDGSIERTGALTRFLITDGTAEIAVAYRGEVPDTLVDGSDVIAEGRHLGGELDADRVLAKCSSKFVPKDRPEHLGRE